MSPCPSAPALLHRRLSEWLLPAAVAVLAGGLSRAGAQEKTTFQDHIRPIFESACNSCHNPDKKKGGLDLTSYAALMAGGSSGEIVAAGDPSASRLYGCVTKTEEPVMPPQGDGLNTAQLETIKLWIEGGLLDTPDGVARKAKKPAFSAQLSAAPLGKPDGPPPMPQNLPLEPVVTTRRAAATSALAASPWSPLVALSSQRQILLYQSESLELAGILPVPDGGVASLAFSRNGQLLVAGTGIGGKSGKVIAWEVTTGRRVFEVGEERDTVLAADLSADQSIVALGGPSRRVKLYQTATGNLVKDIKKHTDWVTALQFSPDGVLLATGDRAGGLQIWEGRSGNEYFSLPGHTAAITAVSWRADSNILASASEDGTIRLWEMNEGKEVKKWNAHDGGVQSLHFAHDGRLVSCGRDRQVKAWNQDGAQAVAQNQFSDLTLAACFSHDGSRFIVGDWSGRVSVWNAADGAAVGDLSAAPPTIAQRLAALAPALDQARADADAAEAGKKTLETRLAAAEKENEKNRQTLAGFQTITQPLQASLAAARRAAENLLSQLAAPPPPPASAETTPPDPAGASASASAEAGADALARFTSSARETVATAAGQLARQTADWAAALPAQLATARQNLTAGESTVGEIRRLAADAATAHSTATATLHHHQRTAARWQAAQINALVFTHKEQLLACNAQLEDLTAATAATEEDPATPPDRRDALRAEKLALEQQIASLQQAITTETARSSAILPKD